MTGLKILFCLIQLVILAGKTIASFDRSVFQGFEDLLLLQDSRS